VAFVFWGKVLRMTKRKSKGAYMLSRLAGVSEAGARQQNPERSEETRD
jgi:hypothetical protein